MTNRGSTVGKILLALVLLFAQQQALLHALGHDFERIHAAGKDNTGAGEAFCAKCLAIAHLDHADGVAPVDLFSAAHFSIGFASESLDNPELAAVTAYLSRAPPVFS